MKSDHSVDMDGIGRPSLHLSQHYFVYMGSKLANLLGSSFIRFLTHYESGSAEAGPADAVAVGSVATGADLAAAFAMVSCRTRLVAV